MDVPKRCYDCEYCQMNRELQYYNYPECVKADMEISFNGDNGYERMKWCPLLKEEDKK